MSGTWLNGDGLYVKIGPSESVANQGGEYEYDGPYHLTVLELPDLTLLTASSAIQAGWDNVRMPKNARIEEVEVVVKTAATSGGAATLDIGLVDEDRSTVVDADGLVAALAKTAIDAAGEYNVLRVGSTSVGALVGTTTSQGCLFVANYTTAAFTAGALEVRVKYRFL